MEPIYLDMIADGAFCFAAGAAYTLFKKDRHFWHFGAVLATVSLVGWLTVVGVLVLEMVDIYNRSPEAWREFVEAVGFMGMIQFIAAAMVTAGILTILVAKIKSKPRK